MPKSVFVQHIYISDIKNSAKIGVYVDYLVISVILEAAATLMTPHIMLPHGGKMTLKGRNFSLIAEVDGDLQSPK